MHRALAAIAALFVLSGSQAATLQQLSLDQMTQSATAIVRARVAASYTSRSGPTIYTHYKLEVSESWKGSPAAEVMLPGGTFGGYKQSVPGVPTLQTGAEYVMFLWTSPSTGITHLIGLTQGIFKVAQQADGTVTAARDQIGETMLDATGKNVVDRGLSMNLADMKTRVRSVR